MLIFKKIIQKKIPIHVPADLQSAGAEPGVFMPAKIIKTIDNKKMAAIKIAAIFQLVTKPKFSFPRRYPSVSCS